METSWDLEVYVFSFELFLPLSSFFSETCKPCCCFTCINLQPPSWAGQVSYPPRETGVCFPMEYSHLLSLFFSSESSSKGREHSHMEPGRSRRGELENSEDGEIHPGQRMSWVWGIMVALTALEWWGIGLFFVFRGRIKTKTWNISPWSWCWLFREHENEPHGGGFWRAHQWVCTSGGF